MTVRVNFTGQDHLRDPAASFAQLRAEGPVVSVRFPIIGRVWVTTTEDATSRMLKASDKFTLRRNDGEIAGMQWWMPRTFRALANNMLTKDEPDHTRLRSIVDEAFRRRAVLDMEPRIMAIADELAGELFAEGSPADLVERIFDPFFTTKPPGQGTGLGLDIARRLLRRYHGELSAASRPGRTEFRVSLLCEKPSTRGHL